MVKAVPQPKGEVHIQSDGDEIADIYEVVKHGPGASPIKSCKVVAMLESPTTLCCPKA